MSTLTIRLPDDKHERLKSLAEKCQTACKFGQVKASYFEHQKSLMRFDILLSPESFFGQHPFLYAQNWTLITA